MARWGNPLKARRGDVDGPEGQRGPRPSHQATADSPAARSENPALAAMAQRDHRELTQYQGADVVAVLDDDATPWRMPARAADAVAAALDAVGVQYWATQEAWARTTSWAVLRDDLATVVEAFRGSLGTDGFYYGTGGGIEEISLVADGLAADLVARVTRLSLFQYVRCSFTGRLYGQTQGTTITVWDRDEDGRIRAAVRAGTVQEVAAAGRLELVQRPRWDGTMQPRLAVDPHPTALEVSFPIDAVYLWVDGSDPRWRAKRDGVRQRLGLDRAPMDAADTVDESVATHRFRDRGELRASLRSLETYAPWVRNVYLVTDEQRPTWLDAEHGRVRVIDHREIFADPSVLPSFNPRAIGAQIHRIEGLSEHFLHMNDDVLFVKPVTPSDFFTPQGLLRINVSTVMRPAVQSELEIDLEHARTVTCALLERDFGARVAHLHGHTPMPQRRDVAAELLERYTPEITRTLEAPFRTRDDIVVNPFLHLNYALLTGRGVVGSLRGGYFNVGRPDIRAAMATPATVGRYDVVCVNDVPAANAESEPDPQWLPQWLEETFPIPTPYELDRSTLERGPGA